MSFTLTSLLNAQTWMQENTLSNNKMNTVGFAGDNLTGWVFGDSTIGVNFQYGIIYKTTNQGFSWGEQDMGTDSIKILDCHVFSAQSVIGVGKFQTTGGGAVIRSVDGGVTWLRDTSSIPERLFDVEFEDGSNGWIVGRNGYLSKTINAGGNWSTQNSGTSEDLFAISFSSLTNGWAVGSDGGTGGIILHTSDGGVNWSVQPTTSTGDLTGVFAINADTAYIVGQSGLILFTSDGGLNWTPQTSGTINDLNDIEFDNGLTGRTVGNSGTILITNDAGVTWSAEVSNALNDINDLFHGVNNINWNCGDNGDVYIFSTIAPNGIGELEIFESKVYPNPAIGKIQFELDLENNADLIIYDMNGLKVSSLNLLNDQYVDISNYESGVYFYVITTENQKVSIGKFIKK